MCACPNLEGPVAITPQSHTAGQPRALPRRPCRISCADEKPRRRHDAFRPAFQFASFRGRLFSRWKRTRAAGALNNSSAWDALLKSSRPRAHSSGDMAVIFSPVVAEVHRLYRIFTLSTAREFYGELLSEAIRMSVAAFRQQTYSPGQGQSRSWRAAWDLFPASGAGSRRARPQCA